MTEKERPCNGLESMFVKANIRFVVGLSFPPQSNEELLVDILHKVLSRVNCGILVTDPPTLAKWNEKCVSVHIEDTPLLSLRETLCRNAENEMPVQGAGSYTLYRNDSGNITMTVWNINHAIMDAIAIKGLVKDFYHRLLQPTDDLPHKDEFSMQNWLEPVNESLESLSTAESDPPYLPIGTMDPIKLSKIIGILPEQGSAKQKVADDIIMVLHMDTVEMCVDLARWHKQSFTSLCLACWARAIAEIYYSSEAAAKSSQCIVAISVLVDLRRYISQKNLLQTIATVTVALDLKETNVKNVTEPIPLVEQLWTLSAAMKQDLQSRIDRGEAHWNAIALAEGKVDDMPPATLELSNHGIYEVPDGCHIQLTQRFDDYEGLSVILHTESASRECITTASCGKDLDPTRVQALVDRVKELLEMVATCN